MKGTLRKLGLVMVIAAILITVIASSVSAKSAGPLGPAPNSGDGVSDGSGLDAPHGPIADTDSGVGPAPNSGDGTPDGSGF